MHHTVNYSQWQGSKL